MKKRILYIFITLMSVSLIGIIWVQVYWIHNGIQVKEAQFDQLVNDALNNVVIDIEDNESINFIHNQLAATTSNFTFNTDSIERHAHKIQQWAEKFEGLEGDSGSYNYEVISEGEGEDMEMKISINGNTQVVDISHKMKKLEQILDHDSLKMLGEDGKEFANRFGNIIIKMVKEFKGIDQPIQHLLNSINLRNIVESNLEDNGITIPFTYGVLHEGEIIEEFSDDGFELKESTHKVNLFKHSLLDPSAQLALNFGGKRHYILKSMWIMVTGSILFTLIIIFTFASTMHYMFKQKKLSEMKNDFINNMTHEFKTPISTISLAVDSITHPKIIENKEKINHYADIIRKENQRMNKQVESVLNTAMGERDELEFNKIDFDFNDIMRKVPERMKLQLDANKATLELNLSQEKLTIYGDEMHLQNAICNLIDNAIKYSERDPEITIATNYVNGNCEITVRDNGIGMTKETQKKVFDKFYRVQKGNIHTIKGFGIGLSYVKAIVDAHKGLISLKSKPKEGTTIIINIPIKN